MEGSGKSSINIAAGVRRIHDTNGRAEAMRAAI
jgi:hypothetical protein